MRTPNSKNPDIDLTTKKFLEEVSALDTPSIPEMTADEARNFLREIQHIYDYEQEAVVEDTEISTANSETIPLRIVRPAGDENEKLPAIIYIHGGGWVMGDRYTHLNLIKRLARHTKSAVIFPEYTHSPEAVYPEAINQIYSQLLLYPVTDAKMKSDSYKEFENGPWLTKKSMEYFWKAYLNDKKQEEDIYVSPVYAEIDDLRGLPPALIITNENDVLRDEGEEYGRKLTEAGVSVMNVRINGTIHDCMMLNGLSQTPPVKAAFYLTCKTLKKVLHN